MGRRSEKKPRNDSNSQTKEAPADQPSPAQPFCGSDVGLFTHNLGTPMLPNSYFGPIKGPREKLQFLKLSSFEPGHTEKALVGSFSLPQFIGSEYLLMSHS